MNELSHHYPPIGVIRTGFTQKFGVPRQSLMISEARGIVKLNPDPGYRTALNHLSEFSHLWLVFVFHHSIPKGWRPTIRPPRLDAPRRVGVFASRSPHRPNPIGISAVALDRIDFDAPGGIEIHVSGVDLMDDTPILDIKPYIPYSDSIPAANSGWIHSESPKYEVTFAESCARDTELLPMITQTLQWDPRPTSQRRGFPIEAEESQGKSFGLRIREFEVKWVIRNRAIHVLSITSFSITSSPT